MSDELYIEYNAAIGSLMVARKLYADACQHQGVESQAAVQAKDYLTLEIQHRDQVRERYDVAARGRSTGWRDG